MVKVRLSSYVFIIKSIQIYYALFASDIHVQRLVITGDACESRGTEHPAQARQVVAAVQHAHRHVELAPAILVLVELLLYKQIDNTTVLVKVILHHYLDLKARVFKSS